MMKPVCDSGTCSGMSTRGCTAMHVRHSERGREGEAGMGRRERKGGGGRGRSSHPSEAASSMKQKSWRFVANGIPCSRRAASALTVGCGHGRHGGQVETRVRSQVCVCVSSVGTGQLGGMGGERETCTPGTGMWRRRQFAGCVAAVRPRVRRATTDCKRGGDVSDQFAGATRRPGGWAEQKRETGVGRDGRRVGG